MTDRHPFRFGRLPHDPQAVAAAPHHRFGAVAAAPVVDRRGIEFVPSMFSNDTNPNCTAVAMANLARGIAKINGYTLNVDPAAPLRFYADCVGNPPDLAATDGAVALDVLKRQAAAGYDIGPQSLAGLFGTVRLVRNSLALGIDRLGGGYWGVTLRERDMERGPVWDVVPGRDDGAIVGGHMVNVFDYTGLGDDDTVRIGTWGGWQRAEWRWVAARLDEAYGIVWRELARPDGSSCSAASVDALADALVVVA